MRACDGGGEGGPLRDPGGGDAETTRVDPLGRAEDEHVDAVVGETGGQLGGPVGD